MDKILLDVNVCLDFLLDNEDRKPFAIDAAKIVQASENGKINAAISATSFDTMFYLMRPKHTVQDATDKLKRLSSITSTAPVGSMVIQSSLDAGWNDLEDAIQYFSGVFNECEAMITRNSKDFNPNSIPVLTPKEYISSYLQPKNENE